MKNWGDGLFVVGGWVFWQVVGPVGQVSWVVQVAAGQVSWVVQVVGQVSWVVQVVGRVSLGVVGEVEGVFLWLLGEAVGVS